MSSRLSAFILALALALTPLPASSASPPSPDSVGEEKKAPDVQLEEIQVVSTPIIEGNQVDNFSNQTTTVTREQIWDMNAPDMTSALRRTPGVNISRYDAIGSFGGAEGGGVFIRGMGSSRPGAEIVTMIDGTPAYAGLWNHPLMDMLSVDPFEAVTVRKGSQPTMFGNAFAALDMAPKRMTREGFKTRLTGQFGSFNTWQETAETGGKMDRVDYYVGQSFRSSDGHRDLSNGQLTSYYGLLGFEPNQNWRVSGFANVTDSFANDPGPVGHPEERDGRFETRATHAVATLENNYEVAKGTIKAYVDSGQAYWYNQSGVDNDTKTDWTLYGLRVKETLALWPGGEILLGSDFDWLSGRAAFTTDYGIVSFPTPAISGGKESTFDWRTWNIVSPYAGLNQTFGDKKTGFFATPSAGLRYYAHGEFKSEWSPQAGLILGYKDFQVHGSYARGVKYPGLDVAVFSQSVIPSLGQSWRDLDPETVDHFEVGAAYKHGTLFKIDASLFSENGHNRYVMYPASGRPEGYRNYDTFTIQGVESTLTVTPLDNLSLFTGATYMNHTPEDLPYAPDWTLSFGGNYRFFEHFKISADAQYQTEQYVLSQTRRVDALNTSKVDGFWLVNAKLSYLYILEKPKMDGEFFVAGQNLTDSSYQYRPGYPMPGIGVSVGMALTF